MIRVLTLLGLACFAGALLLISVDAEANATTAIVLALIAVGISILLSTVVLELEDENGTVRRFDRDVPVPLPIAWSHRLGKRFNLPFLGADLNSLMAFEVRREGMDVDVSRGAT